MTKSLLALTVTSTLAVTAALGNPFVDGVINAPESGVASYSFTDATNGSSHMGQITGSLGVDPISQLTTLCYRLNSTLPYLPLDGDVLLLETVVGNTNQLPSDLLRFVNGNLYFFSDFEPNDPNPGPADVGLPPLTINPVFLLETGPEGNNGALYTPLPGQPGFDPSGNFPGLTYNFISDVPEPGSLSLLLVGAGVWGVRLLRREKREA